MGLGARIADLRNRRGWSQSQLAQKLNIGVSTLGMWETDKRKPNPDALLQLSNIFHVTSDYLLGNLNTPEWASQRDVVDLKNYLDDPEAQDAFNFEGKPLTDTEKEKLQIAITQIFWDRLKQIKEK